MTESSWRDRRDELSKIKMCIYKITNKINGKSYIGQTINSVYRRWTAHSSKRKANSVTAIGGAIQKHGEDNFNFTVLDIAETQEQLDHKERFWIATLNTVAPFGYNLELGGNGTGKISESTKEILRHKNKLAYERDPTLSSRCTSHLVNRKWSKEDREKASRSAKLAHQLDANLSFKKTKHQIGVPRDIAVCMKISQTLKGRNHSPERMAAIKAGIKPLSVEDRLMLSRKRYKGKPFIIDGVVYITPLEASLSTGIPSCDISRAIRVGAPMIRGVGIEVLT